MPKILFSQRMNQFLVECKSAVKIHSSVSTRLFLTIPTQSKQNSPFSLKRVACSCTPPLNPLHSQTSLHPTPLSLTRVTLSSPSAIGKEKEGERAQKIRFSFGTQHRSSATEKFRGHDLQRGFPRRAHTHAHAGQKLVLIFYFFDTRRDKKTTCCCCCCCK